MNGPERVNPRSFECDRKAAMDGYLAAWHSEVDDSELPIPFQRKPLGLDNELMEILWHNGEAVLHSQTNRKPTSDPACKFNQVGIPIHSTEEEAVSWIDSPIDGSFHKDFCADLLSEIPTSHLVEPNKFSGAQSCARPPLPPPPARFGSFESAGENQRLDNLQFRFEDQKVSNSKQCFVAAEPSVMTLELSHGSSSQASGASSCLGVGSKPPPAELEDNHQNNKPENAGAGGSCRNASSKSNDNKRKIRDVEDTECPSEATQMESPGGNKHQPSQKSSRRCRVAEVHNLSERRRRDRINEKMRALQELIPHTHKSDKASMLDEAIEYIKSLQLQLQWWGGSGMAQMRMLQYIYHSGLGMSPPALPAMQNLMCLSKLPMFGQAMAFGLMPNQAAMGHGCAMSPFNLQNQIPNVSFPEQNPEFMGFQFLPNAKAMSAFNFSSQSAQGEQIAAQPQLNLTSAVNSKAKTG